MTAKASTQRDVASAELILFQGNAPGAFQCQYFDICQRWQSSDEPSRDTLLKFHIDFIFFTHGKCVLLFSKQTAKRLSTLGFTVRYLKERSHSEATESVGLEDGKLNRCGCCLDASGSPDE